MAMKFLTLFVLVSLQVFAIDGVNAFSPTSGSFFEECSTRRIRRHRLYGGYDATIGADPNTPIQIYCSAAKSDEETRTLICLGELNLNFQLIEIMDPKPDWFLRIHPLGITPAIRNPADTDDIIFGEDVNEYLCSLHEAISNDPCPLCRFSDENKERMQVLQHEFDAVTKPLSLAYLENTDPDRGDLMVEDMERSLKVFEEAMSSNSGDFLLGDTFSLLDAYVISSLGPILSRLESLKSYELSTESFPKVSTWFRTCSQRESVTEADLNSFCP